MIVCIGLTLGRGVVVDDDINWEGQVLKLQLVSMKYGTWKQEFG